jgi:hypothetical protein
MVFAIGTQTKHKMTARIGRAIIVVLIGLSVATLPMAAGFAAHVPTTAATEVLASDCDHLHNAPVGKTQKSGSDCISMASCVLHCFSFTGVAAADVAFVPIIGATLQPLRAGNHLSSQLGSLPFRPPRA